MTGAIVWSSVCAAAGLVGCVGAVIGSVAWFVKQLAKGEDD